MDQPPIAVPVAPAPSLTEREAAEKFVIAAPGQEHILKAVVFDGSPGGSHVAWCSSCVCQKCGRGAETNRKVGSRDEVETWVAAHACLPAGACESCGFTPKGG